MRKSLVAGSITAIIGLVILATSSRLILAYLSRPKANAGLQFSFGFYPVSYSISLAGSVVGVALIGVGAWAARGRRVEAARHERPRSDKPVVGN